jgi:hypothetical protein
VARFQELLDQISTIIDKGSDKEREPLLALLKESRLWELLESLEKQKRRKHPRKGCAMQIDCATWRGGFDGVVTDISLGGMFIETDTPVCPQQEITANLYPPGDAAPIRITGEVVWTPRQGVGVRFTSSPAKELKKIIESL